jgi:hypothetical protein
MWISYHLLLPRQLAKRSAGARSPEGQHTTGGCPVPRTRVGTSGRMNRPALAEETETHHQTVPRRFAATVTEGGIGNWTPLTTGKRNDYPSARMRKESSEARRRIDVAREGHATNRSCLTAGLFRKPNRIRWVFRDAVIGLRPGQSPAATRKESDRAKVVCCP